MNRVELIGRLTRDPELRYTSSNIATARFTLAVNRPFQSQNGENGTDFINIVVWRKQAENVKKYVSKGSLVSVEGRIQTGSYENQQGQRVYTTDIVCDSVQNLTPRSSDVSYSEPSYQAPSYNQPQSSNDDYTGTLDISSDDLPF